MIIQIDVPYTTYAISVTVLYKQETNDSLVSRCFRVIDGVVADEDGKNRVVKSEIEDCSTIDAMPVVRCKDCKYYNTIGRSKRFGWCKSMDRGVSDNFYCANGAKMEDKP